MKLLDEIHEYLIKLGYSKEDIEYFDSSSVYIAQEIAMYAHRKQRRVNGKPYFTHPYSVMQRYRNFVGIKEDDYFCLDVDLLSYECGVPYNGVQEVCLMHDVLEDGEITIEQISEIYDDFGLKSYFEGYMKEPLKLLTRAENQDYFEYLDNILTSSVASMVKFMDLSDNMNVITLNVLGDKELNRIKKYADCAKKINDKWHYLENVEKYHILRAQKKMKEKQ